MMRAKPDKGDLLWYRSKKTKERPRQAEQNEGLFLEVQEHGSKDQIEKNGKKEGSFL